MELEAAEFLARSLMLQHSLTDWTFRWDRAKRRFGCCWPTRKLISLSAPLTQLNSVDEVRDTILHEIAHAMVPGGHSRAWRAKCVEIGALPRRCYSRQSVIVPQIRHRRRYIAKCRCAHLHVRVKRPRHAYQCRRCRDRLRWQVIDGLELGGIEAVK